jgi:hypothetical protein
MIIGVSEMCIIKYRQVYYLRRIYLKKRLRNDNCMEFELTNYVPIFPKKNNFFSAPIKGCLDRLYSNITENRILRCVFHVPVYFYVALFVKLMD